MNMAYPLERLWLKKNHTNGGELKEKEKEKDNENEKEEKEELARRESCLVEWENRVKEKEEALEARAREMKEKEERCANEEEVLKKTEERMRQLQAELEKLESALRRKDTEMEKREEAVKQRESALTQREVAVTRAEQEVEEKKEKLETELKQVQEKIEQAQKKEIEQKEKDIEQQKELTEQAQKKDIDRKTVTEQKDIAPTEKMEVEAEPPSPHIITLIDESDTDSDATDSTQSSLFEREPPAPKKEASRHDTPSHPPHEAPPPPEALDVKGPSGLPLYNSNRLKKQADETTETESYDEEDTYYVDDDDDEAYVEEEETETTQPPHVDSSVLVTQLSQMDDASSSSEDDEVQLTQARREGEKEVKNAAVSSILSLVQMNKAVTSGVQASERQMQGSAATTTIHGRNVEVLQRADSTSKPQLSNPRSFLTEYVCKMRVASEYRLQNSRRIALADTYKR